MPVLRVNVRSVALDQTPNAFPISFSTSILLKPDGYLLILYVRFFVRHLDPTKRYNYYMQIHLQGCLFNLNVLRLLIQHKVFLHSLTYMYTSVTPLYEYIYVFIRDVCNVPVHSCYSVIGFTHYPNE